MEIHTFERKQSNEVDSLIAEHQRHLRHYLQGVVEDKPYHLVQMQRVFRKLSDYRATSEVLRLSRTYVYNLGLIREP